MRSHSRHVAPLAAIAMLLATAACAAVVGIEDVPEPSDGGANDGSIGQVDGSSVDGSRSSDSGEVDGAPPPSDGGVGLDGSSDGDAAGPPEMILEAPSTTSYFGTSVAVSSDGTLLAVGAPGAGAFAGSVTTYVLGFVDGKATAKLGQTITTTASAPAGGAARLGASVAFGSSAGGIFTLAIGAPTTAGGSVLLEPISSSDGVPFASPTLITAPTSAVGFGSAVAFDAQGDLYVGAPGTTATAAPAGSVYVYSANSWKVVAGSGSVNKGADLFGASLAPLHGGGVLIGSPAGASNDGAAYLLSEANVKTPITTGAAPVTTSAGSELGQAVALAPDDSLALLGAPGAGAAYLVPASMPTGGWEGSFTRLLPPVGVPVSMSFGRSAAVADDQLAVGATGFVAVYDRLDTTQVRVLTAAPSSFGTSLAYGTVSGNVVLVVGAPALPVTGAMSGGSVHLFHAPAP